MHPVILAEVRGSRVIYGPLAGGLHLQDHAAERRLRYMSAYDVDGTMSNKSLSGMLFPVTWRRGLESKIVCQVMQLTRHDMVCTIHAY